MANHKKHIAVLMGGWSAEREVSLRSGAACANALESLGYRVTKIDVQPDVAAVLAKARPDVAFNALHGRFGEDGCIQGLLEVMKIPYTHSGVLASALAMDKQMAKRVFAAAGLRCPEGRVVGREEMLKGDPLPRPYVVKPNNEGSSVGVHIVTAEDNRPLEMIVAGDTEMATGACNSPPPVGGGSGRGHEHRDTACNVPLLTSPLWGEETRRHTATSYLVEQYIPGREITVAVLDDAPLGVTELRPRQGFYDYAHKYTDGKTEHLCPAPLPKDAYEEAMAIALAAHRALGCRGLSRADLRYDDTKGGKGVFYLLEVNTQPGMTALSLSPEQAAYAGIPFDQLVDRLVHGARLGG